ncbi:3-oxoacyl-ACP synthase [Saccharomonospora cyanea]|uniref:3-oxoacyl-(Acyl-carrier-protein) synthase III n=1 Tax=Saccharomonospora cyanea NA-134 TaxID=882082 RepID=H5XHK7_9PSEU|nr:3-oxoacyl-ACP synthase [Saccharomonospora cyanea]EHR61687.1 3-oxoacyl-(acyl-carrier-protein) synthase III [Saccharomonospora cyanea NA-134]
MGTHVAILGTGGYLPRRRQSASELAELVGMRESTITGKFGLNGKHLAAENEHVSDLATAAGERALAAAGVDPGDIGAVVYFGSTFKDYAVWQAAPKIAHNLGCTRAFALELDYVSCGGPVAMRVCRNMLLAEPDIGPVLAVGASRESALIEHSDRWSQFLFTYGDGAAGAVLAPVDEPPEVEVLGSHMITDGRFADDAMVPAGGTVEPVSHESVDAKRHVLRVENPSSMAGLLLITLNQLTAAARGAATRSGLTLDDIDFVCTSHVKRTAHKALLDALGVDVARSVYLDDTGHMTGVDTLFALDRAAREGRLDPGDHVLLVASGTGCTWAATMVRWGRRP